MGWLVQASMALAGFESRKRGDCNGPNPEFRTNWKNGGRKEISYSGHCLGYFPGYSE